MIDIILVGYGKAGVLHCQCYSKLKELNINIVGVVDNDSKSLKRFINKYYEFNKEEKEKIIISNSLEEISDKIDIRNSVVDLCVPNDFHNLCAKKACDLGAKKIIIEKPIANSLLDARKIEELDADIAIAENYVYSNLTEQLKKILANYNLTPKFVRTEFSKDRRNDTINSRGFLKTGPPHVFTVEMPHQIAIVNYLFGNPIENFGAWCEDMIIEKNRFYEHGEGAIILHHEDGTISYNFSSLDGHKHLPIRHRSVMIYCEGGVKIYCHYPSGGDDAFFGAITIFENNHIAEKLSIHDDTMASTLKMIIEKFKKNEKQLTDAAFGRRNLEIIDYSIKRARITHE